MKSKILILLFVVSIVAGMIVPTTAIAGGNPNLDDGIPDLDGDGNTGRGGNTGSTGSSGVAELSAVSVTGADKGQGGAPGVSGGEGGMGSIDHDGDGGTD